MEGRRLTALRRPEYACQSRDMCYGCATQRFKFGFPDSKCICRCRGVLRATRLWVLDVYTGVMNRTSCTHLTPPSSIY